MNQPSKTDAHGRAVRVNNIRRAQIFLARVQELSLSAVQQYIAENNVQNLNPQDQNSLVLAAVS